MIFADSLFFLRKKSGQKLFCHEFTRPVFVKLFYLLTVFLDHSSITVVCFSSLICCQAECLTKDTMCLWLDPAGVSNSQPLILMTSNLPITLPVYTTNNLTWHEKSYQ